MLTNYSQRDTRFVTIYSLIGMIVVLAASFPLHFVYQWSGELTLVGLFAPVNESI